MTQPIHTEKSTPVMANIISAVYWTSIFNNSDEERMLQLMRQREQVGIRTYGTTLHTFNGLDFVNEALEEAADLFQYIVAALEESRNSENPDKNKIQRLKKIMIDAGRTIDELMQLNEQTR